MSASARDTRTLRLGDDSVPKLCGGDIELGNFLLGAKGANGNTCWEAAVAVLAEIEGTPAHNWKQYQPSAWQGPYSTEPDCQSTEWDEQIVPAAAPGGCTTRHHRHSKFGPSGSHFGPSPIAEYGRRFLASNGGCIYIDQGHLELCTPEVLSAYDYVAAWHAMLRIARGAMERANAKLPRPQQVQVLVNNSDGFGNSYGSHISFLVTRRCWQQMFNRRLSHLRFFATYLASSIIFSGAGKIGAENSRPCVDYQISQRADFYETLASEHTGCRRPIVNSRDESLCGSDLLRGMTRTEGLTDLARLHVIFFDNGLCHVSTLLKVGATQIVLAMIEQGQFPQDILLTDPVGAVVQWSHDRGLQQKAPLMHGGNRTALWIQQAILDRACRFVEAGRADGIVPRAREICAVWRDTLESLQTGDADSLIRKLDWVLKMYILQEAVQQEGLKWGSPAAKLLDHRYSNLDMRLGLYWAMERQGFVQQVVSSADIRRFEHEPPTDTRAYLRAHVLRRAGRNAVLETDWDIMCLVLREKDHGGNWTSNEHLLPMSSPLQFTQRDCEGTLGSLNWPLSALEAFGMRSTLKHAVALSGCQQTRAARSGVTSPTKKTTSGSERRRKGDRSHGNG